MAVLQPIVNIAEICARKGVREFVLSPGSRCAPLIIALARHPEINTKSVSDERAAGFVALGMAQYSRETVGLVCTSGTAVLNYSPAVAEAYYQQIPLLVLTADRPPEWVEQQDGQTINQRNIFGPHVKASWELPVDYTHEDAQWHVNRVINEAINLSQSFPAGPVHVNIPLREPFYPAQGEEIRFEQVRIIEEEQPVLALDQALASKLLEKMQHYSHIMVVAGQVLPDQLLLASLKDFAAQWKVPVLSDIISNAYLPELSITHQDGLLMRTNEELKQRLQPELLITFGNSVISKNLKLFLRRYAPVEHWHIQPAGKVADTFQTLTKVVRLQPSDFFRELNKGEAVQKLEKRISYLNMWNEEELRTTHYTTSFFEGDLYGEFEAVKMVMQVMPKESVLHLANSMSVRYANFLGAELAGSPEVYANRGTSGIDGTNSTALGAALVTEKIVTLITGDVSFFYDRNAFWLNFLPSNLRIVLLNNHGGGIFRMIDGPGKQPELDEYFETKQLLNAQRTAEDAGMEYTLAADKQALAGALKHFYDKGPRAKLIEVTSETVLNTEIFRQYKAGLLLK